MKYDDFVIKIESRQGDTYVISVESPAGEGNSELQLPFELDSAAEIMVKLAGTFRGSTAGSEAATREMSFASKVDAPPVDLPKALFDSLITGTTRSLFDQSLGMIRGSDRGLRIKLQIDPTNADVAKLAGLPWELLYREETRDFLNLSRDTPLVRYLNVLRPFTPLAFKPPLRILVVMSSPAGEAPLNLEQERTLIEQSWARQSGVEVDFLERPSTTQRLSNKLAEKDYHVLHYMGHGDFDKSSGSGVLLLEDENYQPSPVSGQTLGNVILHDVKSMRLVFLNACDTAKSTKTKGQDPFAGVATAMVMAGIPAVVAMQFPITDKAAVEFAGTFYPRIVSGYPVDAAVAEGRKAIRLADANSMEWATPVLFMRSPDGVLFNIETPKEPPASPATTAPQPSMAEAEPSTGGGMSTPVKVVLGVAAAAVLAFFAVDEFMDPDIDVPDISAQNYSVSEASENLQLAGLIVSTDTKGASSPLPKGTVIGTDPAGNTEIKKSTKVTLIVADGTMRVADAVGKNVNELPELFAGGPLLNYSVESEVSSEPEGTVVRTDPDAGQLFTHGQTFTVYVATAGVPTPDVVGQDLVAAMLAITTAGFKPASIAELSMDGKPGKIFKTDPPAGTPLVEDAAVTLFVSAKGGWAYYDSPISGEALTNRRARNLRDAAHNSGRKIGVVDAGEKINVLESRPDGWAKVQVIDD